MGGAYNNRMKNGEYIDKCMSGAAARTGNLEEKERSKIFISKNRDIVETHKEHQWEASVKIIIT